MDPIKLFAGLAILCSAPAWAASGIDALKELEKEVAAAKHEEAPESGWKRELDAEFLLRSGAFYERATPRAELDARRFFLNHRLRSRAKLQNGAHTLTASAWLEFGSQLDTYRGGPHWLRDRHRYSRIVEVPELYWVRSGESSEIAVGRKPFKLGMSTLYSPANRIAAQDLNDPLSPKELGEWQLLLGHFHESYTFTAAVFPVFSVSKSPSARSRWAGTGDSGTTVDFRLRDIDVSTLSASEDLPGNGLPSFRTLLQAKGTNAGVDWFLALLHGPSTSPVVSAPSTSQAVKEYPRTGAGMAGFSTVSGRWEFHGEASYQLSYAGRDDDYLAYAGGFTLKLDDQVHFLGLEQLDTTIEYGGEDITRRQSHAGYQRSSDSARAVKNNLFTRFLGQVSPKVSAGLATVWDFRDGGSAIGGAGEWKMRGDLRLRLESHHFFGKRGTYYGLWRENSLFLTTLTYNL